MQAQGSSPLRMWPVADAYPQILREGHHKQAPATGSPTLVWHMALWPSHPFGDGPSAKVGDDVRVAFEGYDTDHKRFFDEVAAFALRLQERGRVGEPRGLVMTKTALPEFLGDEGRTDDTHAFYTCDPQAVAFTLWWQDNAGPGVPNARQAKPAPSDLRVRVHVQTHRDHATVSFYIDVAKSFGRPQIDDADEILNSDIGERRSKVQRAIQAIRKVSGEQIRDGWVEMSRIPEKGVAEADAKALLDGADYLYDGIWREFAAAFGFDDSAGGVGRMYGERFADFRGLVMSIRGLESAGDKARVALQKAVREDNAPNRAPDVQAYTDRVPDQDVPSYTSGTTGFGPLTRFDDEANEGNTVLKSLWPFMRRMTPWADYCDWVGCGIIGGRALYITALGSDASGTAPNEEYDDRFAEVPAGHLPSVETSRAGAGPRPLRYLIVTKGEPLREQLGRYVERINSLGTMRLFALRNIASIRNAGVHIEVLGRMLDGVLHEWESRRNAIDRPYQAAKKARIAENARLQGKGLKFDLRREADPKLREIERRHIKDLDDLIRATETRVIQLAGRLDSIGEGGSGRMLYVINRARSFGHEFDRMYPTLAIVEIHGWINYKNFVDRSVRPVLELIESTGVRLNSVRSRIQTVTETIQTAALIVETAATRENTKALRNIGLAVWAAWAAPVGLVAVLMLFPKAVLDALASGIATLIVTPMLGWIQSLIG